MERFTNRHGRSATFISQFDALLRKNLVMQSRNMGANVGLIIFPAFICLFLLAVQLEINSIQNSKENSGDSCREGLQYDNPTCAIKRPPKWPVLLQIPPLPQFLALSNNLTNSCKRRGSCSVTLLITGGNRSLAESVGENLFINAPFPTNNTIIPMNASFEYILGTDAPFPLTYMDEIAISISELYNIQPRCQPKSRFNLRYEVYDKLLEIAIPCAEGLHLWRNSSSDISKELSRGIVGGRNRAKKVGKYVAGYDFLNTSDTAFNAIASYSIDFRIFSVNSLKRVSMLLNMASNSYLRFLKGIGMKVAIDFIEDMPQHLSPKFLFDPSSAVPLLFTWVIQLLFPVILTYIVYEKQHKLRVMMMMHGLGNKAYWTISYAYFLVLSTVYLSCFLLLSLLTGVKSSTMNSYSVQFIFYFSYLNLQICIALLASTIFSNVKAASVAGYLYVFASGLLGFSLFQGFLESISFPRWKVLALGLFPPFSLYRGIYELSDHALSAQASNIPGMSWKDVENDKDGMRAVFIIIIIEWMILLPTSYFLDKVSFFGEDRHCCSFFSSLMDGSRQTSPVVQRKLGNIGRLNLERSDVLLEREIVDKLMMNKVKSHAVICDNLEKVYSGKDGNPDKYAVRGLSFAVPNGQCLGILGPNGAGKTSLVNMLIGMVTPTSGKAFVNGIDITKDMEGVYSSMGVCPQHDLLWDMLTGREHLLFYGRLKNLRGCSLSQAVQELLDGVKLSEDGVWNKQVKTYSGGMRRRLSIAISLIGNPQVVYMDEPTTGLDPASRNSLWEVIKQAKKDKAIILTTHSMEEAEVLCDRIGMMVNGQMQCFGNTPELKSRFGGYYSFTITTSANLEREIYNMVHQLSPRAIRTYHISGTQKFDIPKADVKISNVFSAIEYTKRDFQIAAWGLADSSLEDVFIDVVRNAETFEEC